MLPLTIPRLPALLLLILALLLPAARAQPLPAGVERITEVEGITAYRLANGLQLLLVPDATKPSTTVNLTIHVGSRHENYGETGMAHLLEHLIFKGTPTHRNVMAEFGRRGLRYNGSTSFDRTNYFASFAANDDTLRWYLAWQADAMVNSLIARSDLDTEMTVVRNEMEAGENDPVRALLQQTLATMYQWHNYGKLTIGARADVENVDIGRLQAFYRLHYQPDNATLVVAGRFEPAQVLGWVATLFGPIPKPARVLRPTYTVDPAQDGERSLTVRRTGGAPFVLAAWHGVAAAHPDFAATEVLSAVLGNAPSGRLHTALVEQRKLAASSFGFTWGLAEPGPLLLGLQLAPGQDVAAARQALLDEVQALASGTRPVTADELERARTQWLNDWAQGFADPERVGVALSEAIGQGDWRLYFLARDRMRALTLADVQRVAAAYLVADNRTLGTYLPVDQPQRAPAPQLVQVAPMVQGYRGDAAAAQAEAFEATPANLEARTRRHTLASGLKVALLPKGTRGATVQARLVLRFGDADSLKGRAQAVAALGGLIDKGAAGMSRAQLSDAFDKLRADVSVGASGQALTVGITTVRQHLPAVVALVGRMLREPDLPADALDERRRQLLASIASQRNEPGALAANTLARHGNPYPRGDLRHAPSFDELQQDVQALDVAAVRAVWRGFLSAAHGEFAAVGDMDADAVLSALQQALGDWRAPADGPRAYQRVPQPLVAVAPLDQRLRTPDKANAQMELQQTLAVNDDHPDQPALLMANQLLGGDANSRLWTRIREQLGLSYDVRSWLQWNPFEANTPWRASAIFAPGNRAKVEAALREELARVLKEGFSADELNQGRVGLLNQRRLARAQDAAVAGALVSNLYLQRSFARAQQLDDALAALSVQQVNEALRRHLDPARWVVVWAGDFKE